MIKSRSRNPVPPQNAGSERKLRSRSVSQKRSMPDKVSSDEVAGGKGTQDVREESVDFKNSDEFSAEGNRKGNSVINENSEDQNSIVKMNKDEKASTKCSMKQRGRKRKNPTGDCVSTSPGNKRKKGQAAAQVRGGKRNYTSQVSKSSKDKKKGDSTQRHVSLRQADKKTIPGNGQIECEIPDNDYAAELPTLCSTPRIKAIRLKNQCHHTCRHVTSQTNTNQTEATESPVEDTSSVEVPNSPAIPLYLTDADRAIENSSPIPFLLVDSEYDDDPLASSQPIPLHIYPSENQTAAVGYESEIMSYGPGDRSHEGDSSQDEDTDTCDNDIANSSPIPFLLSNEIVKEEECKAQKNASVNDSNYLPTSGMPYKCYKQETMKRNVDWSEDTINPEDITTYSDSDDDDLPEGLTPTSRDKLNMDDTVWVKHKDFPRWPAVVKEIHRTKRRICKVTVEFIEPAPSLPKKLTVNYTPSFVLPFLHSDKEKFLRAGMSHQDPELVQKFRKATDFVTSTMNMKALSALPPEELVPLNLCDKFNAENYENQEEETENPSLKKTSLNSLPAENISKDQQPKTIQATKSRKERTRRKNSIIYVDTFINDIQKSRADKMRVKNEQLIKFCTSNEMKKYLISIWRRKRPSTRHDAYFGPSIKKKEQLKNAGFGPIADEEQMEEITSVMCKWWLELNGSSYRIPDSSYVLDVWVPEAIVYGLIKQKGYGRGRAWEMFQKGVSMTKKEQERLHNSIIQGAKNIPEEDRLLYEEKYEERVRAILGEDADGFLKSMKQSTKGSTLTGVQKRFKLR